MYLFTLEGDPAENYGIPAKATLTNTASDDTFQRADRWIKNCLSQHRCTERVNLLYVANGINTAMENKPTSSSNLSPARLVSLSSFQDPCQDARLVDTGTVCPPYATLSHCWGAKAYSSYTTRKTTLETRKERILYDELPLTFQHAIQITRRLGIQYLWIDSICIIQDSTSDWESESIKMGAIYSNSVFTIASDSSADSNGGCFNQQSVTQDEFFSEDVIKLRGSLHDGRQTCLYVWDMFGNQTKSHEMEEPLILKESPLSQRGWVCQERILSPRTLHFTKLQLVWECRDVYEAEDGFYTWKLSYTPVSGLPYSLDNISGEKQSSINVWYKDVIQTQYSRRNLTMEKDKLPAISGIAKVFHQDLQCSYVAGLWLQDLAWGLSWKRTGKVCVPAVYRSPSFSWASMDTEISWHNWKGFFTVSPDFCVEDFHVKLSTSDPFGCVSGAWLRISGRLKKGIIIPSEKSGNTSSNAALGSLELVWLGEATMDMDSMQEFVDCLLLGKTEEFDFWLCIVLLLRLRPNSSDEYVRIGVAEIQTLKRSKAEFPEWFNEGTIKTVTIF